VDASSHGSGAGAEARAPPHTGPWPTEPLEANPDFYTSVLWKRLMGPRVLSAELPSGPSVLRVHAACARSADGAVVLAFSNPSPQAAELEIGAVADTVPRQEWHLSSAAGAGKANLLSHTMLLNDELLTHESLKPGGMKGRAATGVAAVRVGAWTYGFVLLEAAGAPACRPPPG
jgi:heparanase 1